MRYLKRKEKKKKKETIREGEAERRVSLIFRIVCKDYIEPVEK